MSKHRLNLGRADGCADQMGNKQVTVQNLQVLKVIPENNVLVIKGSIPGSKGSIVVIEK